MKLDPNKSNQFFTETADQMRKEAETDFANNLSTFEAYSKEKYGVATKAYYKDGIMVLDFCYEDVIAAFKTSTVEVLEEWPTELLKYVENKMGPLYDSEQYLKRKSYKQALEDFILPISESMRKDLETFTDSSDAFKLFTKGKYGMSTGFIEHQGERLLNFSYEEAIHTFHSQNPDYDPKCNKGDTR